MSGALASPPPPLGTLPQNHTYVIMLWNQIIFVETQRAKYNNVIIKLLYALSQRKNLKSIHATSDKLPRSRPVSLCKLRGVLGKGCEWETKFSFSRLSSRWAEHNIKTFSLTCGVEMKGTRSWRGCRSIWASLWPPVNTLPSVRLG